MCKIDIGDKVRILHESETIGLVGAILKVVSTSPDYINVSANGVKVRFKPEEVELYMPNIKKRLKSLPKFYHGTDMKMLALDKEKRENYHNICKKIAKYLYIKIKEYEGSKGDIIQFWDESYKCDSELKSGVHNAKASMLVCLYGSEDYQYEDFYLTSWWPDAVNYAQGAFGGGEIGTVAYYLTKAVILAGKNEWLIGLEDVADMIISFGESKRFPVILEFSDIDLESLRTEQDESIDRYIQNGKLNAVDFRYNKSIDFSNAIPHLISSDYEEEMEKWEKKNNKV